MFKNIQLFSALLKTLWVVMRPTFGIKDISTHLIFSALVSNKDYLEVTNGLPVTFL
jgi:hypothetical protein